MALTKTIENDKIEVVGKWNIQIRTATIIKEDGTELSRSYNRYVLEPYVSHHKTKKVDGKEVLDLDSNGKKQWIHVDTDISREADEVKAVANAIWTDSMKAEYKTWKESQEV